MNEGAQDTAPERKGATTPWLGAAATWLAVAVVLTVVLFTSSASSSGTIDTDTGGRTALLVLGLIAGLPLLIRSLTLTIPRWLPWAIGIVSATITLLLGFLIDIGRSTEAWAVYAGLQLLRAREHYADLAWILRWVECDGCAEQDPNYAEGVLWLRPATFNLISESWTPIVGTALALGLSVCLVWLARNTSPRGVPVFVIAAIGSGWLLLLDRANLDGVAFAVPVLAIFLLRKSTSLWVWWVIALLAWVVGTWKYYPFALGLLLLPLIRIHRGWTVIAGFAAATAAFFVFQWESFSSSISDNSEALILYDFPAMGRLPVISRMTDQFDFQDQPLAANIIVALLALAAAWWGATFARRLPRAPLYTGMLGSAGSTLFLASVLIAGFGFGYKAAFLLLLVPLFALPTRKYDRFLLYTSLVGLLLIAIPLIVAYSILLTSLAGITVASMGLGASLTVLWRNLNDPRVTLRYS